MPLYHGTSRVFDRFDVGEQAGGQLGSAFYFTDNEAVAENFAVFRHPPEMRGFDSQSDLDEFRAEHPAWTLTYRGEVGDKIVASFATPDYVPQVITVELHLERVLALDDAAPNDLIAAAVQAGVPQDGWGSALELWDAALEHFHGGPIEEGSDTSAATERLLEAVRAAHYDGVNRPDERNGVAHRTWTVFEPDKIEIISRRELE